jgi:class 3 adenylate cyclase
VDRPQIRCLAQRIRRRKIRLGRYFGSTSTEPASRPTRATPSDTRYPVDRVLGANGFDKGWRFVHNGSLINSTGDGVLATFDGPGRAVRCALSFGAAAKQIGLPLRAGLHTGEIELRGQDIGGIAVHAAARVMAKSQPGEVLVSRVVTDLVAGAGLRFSERGSHELKGLPGRWDLFSASL